MNCEEDRDAVMANLNCLKGNETYNNISVTEDYTMDERKVIKEWNEKAKARNENEPVGSMYEWKVRGSPKNGILLKKFQNRAARL